MDLLLGLLTATLLAHIFVSGLLAALWRRRPQHDYFALGALYSAALVVHATTRIALFLDARPMVVALSSRVGWAALIVAFAFLVHFALVYARVEETRRWLLLTYTTAGAFEVFDAADLLPAGHAGDSVSALFAASPLRGALRAPVGYATVALHAACAVAVVVVLALLVRTYLNGRREALPITVGASLLLAAVINDAGLVSGAFTSLYVVELGFVPVSLGLLAAIGFRYSVVAEELDRRTVELRTRTRELRRSYEELATAQEELVKKEQLAVVGELSAVIAHEVRNPLAIIGNAVAGLRKSTLSREDQSTLLGILEEETTRLNRLVSDLLRYARPLNLQRQHIHLNDLIDRGMALAREAKRLTVAQDVQGDELRVWGDANLLRQVFDNLIDNAVQAMSTGGTLTVRVRPTTTAEGIAGIAVCIIDTGEGMDTQVRSRAKDPFFTTRPSGTGLGLAIVDRIVDAHGGRLLIESRAGEGTTVTVLLPFGSASEPPPNRDVLVRPAAKGRRPAPSKAGG